MLKWIAPISERLRHLQRPRMFSVRTRQEPDADRPSTGQLMAERVAGLVGSWAFLGVQAGFLLLWLIFNTVALTHAIHFDPFPYILLNLLLSFQAGFTGPVLLIAANVGAIRDHAQADRIEKLAAQNEKLNEQNEKLNEQNEKLVSQLCDLEEMVDQHITASAKAHSAEIADLVELVRAVHTSVTSLVPGDKDPAPASTRRRRDPSANSRS
jgi:uncharacterized membrane protein